MYTNPILLIRLLINNRRLWIPCLLFLGLCVVTVMMHESEQNRTHRSIPVRSDQSPSFPFQSANILTYDQVKLLLDRLFVPSTSLVDIQNIWNQLMEVWSRILNKFLHDACEYCHQNHSYCYESIDLARYIYYINESFYPSNEIKRPLGMGIYYYFDLKNLRSINNTILPTDVSPCDYFHMLQLMINVQLVLHQAQIKYFLTKGTLIGALRHHDVIPWDTDIDLFIPSSATAKILKSFRQLDLTTHKLTTTTEASTTRAKKE